MNKFKINARYALMTGPVMLESQDLYTADTVQNHPIGLMAFTRDGRYFRYSLVGASALVAGNLLQAAAEDTSYENMSVLASPIVLPQNGVQTVNITNGTATITNAQFVDGSISVYTTPDLGKEYTILGVTGTLTSGGALTVTIDRPLATAWTTSTKVNMKRSPWSGVIQAPATTQTDMAVGVAPWAATAAQYTWVQTHGLCTVLSDGSIFAVGSDVGTPSGTAGCVTVFAAGTTHQRIGVVRQAAASGHCLSMFLQID